MPRTRVSIPSQVKVNQDIDANQHKIINLADPVNDQDAVNFRTFQSLSNTVSETAGQIGQAEDTDYTDGLFTDFVPSTPTGTAVDRFNEILKALAPSPAPNFSSISFADSGQSGKLSFGASNAISGYTNHPTFDMNDDYTVSGTRRGIFNDSTVINGSLADNINPGHTNGRPFPNNVFGDGDKGNLILELNGTPIHQTDLTTFNSGSSVNVNGSGFNLSASTPVEFDDGTPLELFRYRSGTWTVSPSDQRPGYNFVRVRHEYAPGQYRDSETFEWIVDDADDSTTFGTETLDSLSMSGSNYISGIQYYTSGTAQYDLVVSNAYKNTYSRANNAVNYSGTNCSASDESLPQITTDENQQVIITDKAVNVSTSSRLLNESISISTTIDRVLLGDVSSSGSSISGILLDATSDDATNTNEPFNGEGYRVAPSVDVASTAYSSGAGNSPATWDSTISLISADANYNTGLLVSNGRLTYPTNTSHISGITNGDFSAVVNGPANENYSTASGERTYIRYFYSSGAHSNFRLNLNVSNTSFVDVATGTSGNNLTLEILAPNTTKNSLGDVVWKDATVAHSGTDTDLGCYAGTFGDNIPSQWGITLGAENTSTSGNVILVRITASSSWTGNIDNISITWL